MKTKTKTRTDNVLHGLHRLRNKTFKTNKTLEKKSFKSFTGFILIEKKVDENLDVSEKVAIFASENSPCMINTWVKPPQGGFIFKK